MTFANLYFNSGTNAIARAGREKICSEILPNLQINSQESGCVGGDLNCIIDAKDATKYPEAKKSKCLQKLVKVRSWKDSFRSLHPTSLKFSRFYENYRAEGIRIILLYEGIFYSVYIQSALVERLSSSRLLG